MRKYQELVRPDAPWCPTNIEFIRRINGLDSDDDVQRIVFDASYLVLGFGDVYLGAPVATPLDPRHRLVTTKYNPARTWTPENAVGIGGAYLCIYGMEGPGGYQFFGRTIQMWNRWRTTACFDDKPWLLRFFDRDPLLPRVERGAAGSARGLPAWRLSDPHRGGPLPLAEHRAFSPPMRRRSPRSRRTQQDAFEAERQRWTSRASIPTSSTPTCRRTQPRRAIPEGCRPSTRRSPAASGRSKPNRASASTRARRSS